jgi:FtsP/CotA-like multicopper oxidase with cupredoxin domain
LLISPDIPVLPYRKLDGRKFFELSAQPVAQEILPGLFINGWGYNGSIPGPVIEAYPGESITVRVKNYLPEGTSIHFHGVCVRNSMDGVPFIEPTPIVESGYFFDYHFKVPDTPGTYMYYPHCNTHSQARMGLGGAFIILDPNESGESGDYVYALQEFHVQGLVRRELSQGIFELDTLSDTPNFYTLNGRCYPHTSPVRVYAGERIRLRFINLGQEAHPMHVHGHSLEIAACDGFPVCPPCRKHTLPILPGETYDTVLYADNPGIWPLHCHIGRHTANNSARPFGGMSTLVEYLDN